MDVVELVTISRTSAFYMRLYAGFTPHVTVIFKSWSLTKSPVLIRLVPKEQIFTR